MPRDQLCLSLKGPAPVRKNSLLKIVSNQKYLIAMTIPGLLWIFVFQYLPLYGIVVTFQEYDITRGFFRSDWIGFDNYRELFTDSFFITSLKSTLLISVLKIAVGFPAPIVFAVLLNELHNQKFKSLVQSFTYLPYFLSWVFVVGFTYNFFAADGAVNKLLSVAGLAEAPVIFMASNGWFLVLIILTEVWKGFGWNSIIYLANMTTIDPQIYESAIVDGANRFRRMVSITIPMLKPTIVLMLILSISNLMNSNFDQMFLMSNPLVQDISDVLSVYTYKTGILTGRYSYASTIGLFISVVSLVLLQSANFISRRLTGESIY